MHNFLYLILEELTFGKKRIPKARVTAIKRVAGSSNWRKMGVRKKYKKILPKKSSLFGTRTLMNQTDATRRVWDSEGYKAQKFYDNMYRKL